jgi:hypothetical protein
MGMGIRQVLKPGIYLASHTRLTYKAAIGSVDTQLICSSISIFLKINYFLIPIM